MWMLRGVMRVFVRPTVVPEDALARLHGRARPLLYVLEERSTSDLLALEIACMQGGLRRPGKRLKLRGLDLPHSAVALERRAGVLRRRADRRTPPELARAVAAAGADPALELDIVPVAVYWGRAPQREKSWLGLMFSENWAFVGPFRRLLSIVFNGRSTLIRFGEPRPIQGYAAAGPDGARGARRLLKDMRARVPAHARGHARAGPVAAARDHRAGAAHARGAPGRAPGDPRHQAHAPRRAAASRAGTRSRSPRTTRTLSCASPSGSSTAS